jgi:regulator of protease activity HflC (stomatin/prohibitin superfamily)
MAVAIPILVLVLFALLYLASGVRIVRPYQRALVEQLGRYKATVDPGLRLLLPGFQSLRSVDMREQVIDVPPQEVITSDNVVVSVDAVIYYEPTDPQRLAYNIGNFILAITKLGQTNLRNLVGDMQLDEALTSRDSINTHLRQILDDATDKWGVRVVRVEIQRIDPPVDVMHAMHEQMKAERTRRALVTQAEGDRQAAITRAEGTRQATILAAEANKQQQILAAEGDAEAVRARADAERYRREAVAAGEANATRTVYEAIHDGRPTADLLAVKYLEALQGMADGRATKLIVPAELGGLMGSLAGIAELFTSDGSTDRDRTEAEGPQPDVDGRALKRRPATPPLGPPSDAPPP